MTRRTNDDKTEKKFDFWANWAVRLLSAFIIPLAVWMGTVHSNQAVQTVTVTGLEEDIAELKEQLKQVNENENSLVRLETEMKNANGKLDDIKRALVP